MATKTELVNEINKLIREDANLAEQIISAAKEIAEEAKRNKAAVADQHSVQKRWLLHDLPVRVPQNRQGLLSLEILLAIIKDENKTMKKCLKVLGNAGETTWRCANQNSRD